MTGEIKQFASSYLSARGWTYSGDVERLAAKIEECCEEFMKELEERYEKECG